VCRQVNTETDAGHVSAPVDGLPGVSLFNTCANRSSGRRPFAKGDVRSRALQQLHKSVARAFSKVARSKARTRRVRANRLNVNSCWLSQSLSVHTAPGRAEKYARRPTHRARPTPWPFARHADRSPPPCAFLFAIDQQCGKPRLSWVGDIEQMVGEALRCHVRKQELGQSPRVAPPPRVSPSGDEGIGRLLDTVRGGNA